jgi:hypothetical protein
VIAVSAVVLAVLLAASTTLFAQRVRFLVALLRTGAPATRDGDTQRRVRNETTIVLGQSDPRVRVLGLPRAGADDRDRDDRRRL